MMLKRVMECGGMIRIQFGNPLFQLLKKVEQNLTNCSYEIVKVEQN